MASDRIRIVIEGDSGDLVREVGQARRAIDGLGQTARRQSASMAALGAAANRQRQSLQGLETAARRAAVGVGLLGGAGLVKAAQTGIRFNAQLESNTIALENFLGSAGRARTLLGELFETAKRTPFQFSDITRASRQMLAFGFSVDQTKKTLDAIGNAAAALGGGNEEIQRMVIAFGQMETKGRVMGQELLQLTEVGVPATKILREELGLTSEQVRRIGEEGIDSGVAIEALTRGMQKRFGEAALEQSKSFDGMMSTLRDNWAQTTGAMTEGLFQEIKGWLPAVNATLEDIASAWNAHPDMDLAGKLFLTRAAIGRNLGPLFDEIEREIDRADLGDKLADGFEDAFPKMAEAAAKGSGRAAEAFFNGWLKAGIWGKLVTAGFLASKLGAFHAGGAFAARKFGDALRERIGPRLRSIFTGAATSAATTAGAAGADAMLTSTSRQVNKSGERAKGIGRNFGRNVGRGIIAGVLVGLAANFDQIEEWLEDKLGHDSGGIDIPGPDPNFDGFIPDSVPGLGGLRRGGLVRRFAAGGLVPAAVSSGELLVFPDGGAAQVPGPRVAADNVRTALPAGTMVFTDHGQQLLAGGASLGEALRGQLPHFNQGGLVGRATQYAGIARGLGWQGTKLKQLLAIMFRESRYNPRARNNNPPIEDSRGLMQINRLAWDGARVGGMRIDADRLYDPAYNLRAATAIHRQEGWEPWNFFRGVTAEAWRIARRAATGSNSRSGGGAPAGGVTRPDRRQMLSGIVPDSFRRGFEAGSAGEGLRGFLGEVIEASQMEARDLSGRRRRSGGSGSASGGGSGGFRPGGGWAGTENLVMQAIAGVPGSKSYKRAANHPLSIRNPSSDHNTANRNAFAADISPGSDGIFQQIARRLSIPARKGSWNQFANRPLRGFRSQLLWHAPDGSHRDHVHLGIRRLSSAGVASFREGGSLRGTVDTLAGLGRNRAGNVGARQGLKRLLDQLEDAAFTRVARLADYIRDEIRELLRGGLTGRERIQVRRLRSALSVTEAEGGRRVGRLVRQADQLGERERLGAERIGLVMRAQGIDPDSAQGLRARAQLQATQAQGVGDQIGLLRRAAAQATRMGQRGVARELQQKIAELELSAQELAVGALETQRQAVAQAAAEQTQTAEHGARLQSEALRGLELRQRLAGNFDTAAGAQQRAEFIQAQVVPGLQATLGPLAEQLRVAQEQGNTPLAQQIAEQIAGRQNDILQAQLDAQEVMAEAARQAQPNFEELYGLQKDINQELRNGLRLSEAHFSVFGGFAALAGLPRLGGFAIGTDGRRVGRTGLAYVHEDEVITPAPRGPGSGGQPVQVQVVVAGDMGGLIRVVDARVDGKTAGIVQRVDRQIGRDARRTSFAPGR